jgi:DNA-binding HxlR family transcriptional regulator
VPGIKRSDCGIARALDLIGDKWTLLIMRDALFLTAERLLIFSTDQNTFLPICCPNA